MAVPTTPVTLSPEQLDELNRKLAFMRHQINNHLSLVIAAVELVRYKPELRDKMLDTLEQQAPRITAEIATFSSEFERTLGFTKD